MESIISIIKEVYCMRFCDIAALAKNRTRGVGEGSGR